MAINFVDLGLFSVLLHETTKLFDHLRELAISQGIIKAGSEHLDNSAAEARREPGACF